MNPRAHAQASARYGDATFHVLSATRRYERVVREVEYDRVDGGRTYDQGGRLQRLSYQVIWATDDQHEQYERFLAEIDGSPRLLVDPLFGAIRARAVSIETRTNAEELCITASLEFLESGDVEEPTFADPTQVLAGSAAISAQGAVAQNALGDVDATLVQLPALDPWLSLSSPPEAMADARGDLSAALRALEETTDIESARAHRELLLLRLAWDVTTSPAVTRTVYLSEAQPALSAFAEIGITDDAEAADILAANPAQDPLRLLGRLEVPNG